MLEFLIEFVMNFLLLELLVISCNLDLVSERYVLTAVILEDRKLLRPALEDFGNLWLDLAVDLGEVLI